MAPPQKKETPIVTYNLPGLGSIEINPAGQAAAPPAMPLTRDPRMMELPGLGTIEINPYGEGELSDENPLVTIWRLIKENPGKTGAMVGGLALTPFTGGMSLPAALGLAGGVTAGGTGVGLAVDKLAGGDYTKDMTLPQALTEMGVEGLYGIGGEGTGRVGRWGVQKGANWMMNSALGAQKALREDFPTVNLGETLNRRFINPTTKRGVAKAERLLSGATQRRNAVQDAAEAAGVPPISLSDPDVWEALKPVIERSQRMVKAGRPDPLASMLDRWSALEMKNPGGIRISDVSDILSELENEGGAALAAFKAGQVPHNIGAEMPHGLATGVRNVARKRVPGLEGANRDVQELIAALRTAKDVSTQPMMLGGRQSHILGTGAGAGAYTLTHDPLSSLKAFLTPILLGSQKISAPAAMTTYQASRTLPALLRLLGAGIATPPQTQSSMSDAGLDQLLRDMSQPVPPEKQVP